MWQIFFKNDRISLKYMNPVLYFLQPWSTLQCLCVSVFGCSYLVGFFKFNANLLVAVWMPELRAV